MNFVINNFLFDSRTVLVSDEPAASIFWAEASHPKTRYSSGL
jgi:hypothetical protein